MLTQLATVRARLGLTELETQHDPLLVRAIQAVSARFDKETNRTLARCADLEHEFGAAETELCPRAYPIETITRFDLKTSEAEGWVEQTSVEYLLRRAAVVSLALPLGGRCQLARLIYTGGYVLPATTPEPGQTALPADLENAVVEQVAWWFLNRDRLGLTRIWEYHGVYRHFGELDLLPAVRATLRQYARWEW